MRLNLKRTAGYVITQIDSVYTTFNKHLFYETDYFETIKMTSQA